MSDVNFDLVGVVWCNFGFGFGEGYVRPIHIQGTRVKNVVRFAGVYRKASIELESSFWVRRVSGRRGSARVAR